jgi:hypothetical protein
MTTTPAPGERPKLDTTIPHSARIWNYWLGGKDNFAPDREVGDQIQATMPDMVPTARAIRAFLKRSVRYLAGEAGIRQFLDIGTGLPTADNTHQVAQAVAPESRIVYVDNDPLVLVHARALLTSAPEGKCDYIEADVHDPETIVREAARTLDFSQPVALMLLAIVHFILDDAQARAVVKRLVDAMPSGSYMAMVHAVHSPATDAAIEQWNAVGTPKMCARSEEEIRRFFDGLELLEPGLVPVASWRPEAREQNLDAGQAGLCAVGRKA